MNEVNGREAKIGFVGAQGSGKTTRAYELATALKKAGKDVYILSEVARSCPFELNEKATEETQLWIFGKQLTREQSSKGQILISDRTLMDSFCYGIRACPRLFKELEGFVREYLTTYDYIFYLKPNNDYLIDDGVRSTNAEFRDEIDNIITGYLEKFSVPYVEEEDVERMARWVLGGLQ